MNMTLETMQVELDALRAQARHLNEEVRWLRETLSRQKWELADFAAKPRPSRGHVRSNKHGPRPFMNEGQNPIAPLEASIAEQEARLALLVERQTEAQAEVASLGALVDQCKRHSGLSTNGIELALHQEPGVGAETF